jgi:hypothetical protein
MRRPADEIGWFDPERADSAWRRIVGSHDPLNPGVSVRRESMRIGMQEALDGRGDDFTITAVSQAGFWGWWMTDLGIGVAIDTQHGRLIPNPAGYFCAIRVP